MRDVGDGALLAYDVDDYVAMTLLASDGPPCPAACFFLIKLSNFLHAYKRGSRGLWLCAHILSRFPGAVYSRLSVECVKGIKGRIA